MASRTQCEAAAPACPGPAAAATSLLLRRQSGLAEFGRLALREEKLDRLLNEAARLCAETLGAPWGRVCRYRHETNDLAVAAASGWPREIVGEVLAGADVSTPHGRAFVTGEPVMAENLADAGDFALPAFYADHGIVATVAVAIHSASGVGYGVLAVDSPSARRFDQHEVGFLVCLASVLAEAVAAATRIELLRAALAQGHLQLQEQGVLARELQHRVRNNLHTLHALLTSEIGQDEGGSRTDALAAIARRVLIMARVYDHLLGSGMARRIDLGVYLTSLCAVLPQTLTAAHAAIAVVCDADPVTLDLDRVTALGMVVAELVANAVRHAFPAGSGRIAVSLRHAQASDDAMLTVRDDGVGLPPLIGDKRHGLGLAARLMQQVGGRMEVIAQAATRPDGRGTAWLLTFPVAPPPAS